MELLGTTLMVGWTHAILHTTSTPSKVRRESAQCPISIHLSATMASPPLFLFGQSLRQLDKIQNNSNFFFVKPSLKTLASLNIANDLRIWRTWKELLLPKQLLWGHVKSFYINLDRNKAWVRKKSISMKVKCNICWASSLEVFPFAMNMSYLSSHFLPPCPPLSPIWGFDRQKCKGHKQAAWFFWWNMERTKPWRSSNGDGPGKIWIIENPSLIIECFCSLDRRIQYLCAYTCMKANL